MKCPVCDVEARVKMLPQIVKKNDKFYHKMVFECRNKECDRYETEVGTDYIEVTVTEE